jgi:2-phospho-L-lactate transferase/gluconeogenesis factor (CofD/UPF0052 family)
MTQPGETDRLSLRDHLDVLGEYIDLTRFDRLFVNDTAPDRKLLAGYIDEAAEPVRDDLGSPNEYGLVVVRSDVLGSATWEGRSTIKHDPKKLARILVRETRAFGRPRREPPTP